MLCGTTLACAYLTKPPLGEPGVTKVTVAVFSVLTGFRFGLTQGKDQARLPENGSAPSGRIIGLSRIAGAIAVNIIEVEILLLARKAR